MNQRKTDCALRVTVIVATTILGIGALGCDRPRPKSDAAAYVPVKRGERVSLTPDSESKIRAFCGDCHAFPQPNTFSEVLGPPRLNAAMDCISNRVAPTW